MEVFRTHVLVEFSENDIVDDPSGAFIFVVSMEVRDGGALPLLTWYHPSNVELLLLGITRHGLNTRGLGVAGLGWWSNGLPER